jgi:hypothetical protein
MAYYLPGPHFGYTLRQIGNHPWNTLITMKEVLRLEPGSLEFTGPSATEHQKFWMQSNPELFTAGRQPVFVLDTKVVHPHSVEVAPRQPFQPWKT